MKILHIFQSSERENFVWIFNVVIIICFLYISFLWDIDLIIVFDSCVFLVSWFDRAITEKITFTYLNHSVKFVYNIIIEKCADYLISKRINQLNFHQFTCTSSWFKFKRLFFLCNSCFNKPSMKICIQICDSTHISVNALLLYLNGWFSVCIRNSWLLDLYRSDQLESLSICIHFKVNWFPYFNFHIGLLLLQIFDFNNRFAWHILLIKLWERHDIIGFDVKIHQF